MLRGICIDAGQSSNLEVGCVYYLFEHGTLAYYASNFPKEFSHFGAYAKSKFEIIKEEEPSAEVFFTEADDDGQLKLF